MAPHVPPSTIFPLYKKKRIRKNAKKGKKKRRRTKKERWDSMPPVLFYEKGEKGEKKKKGLKKGGQ